MSAIDNIKPYAKAIVGFITPGVVALVAAVNDASPAGQHITVQEWVGIGAVCLLTGGGVFAVPNSKPAPADVPAVAPEEAVTYDGQGAPIVDDRPIITNTGTSEQ